ncbi:hypothetical protein ILUMI_11517 [Ignelater luminosus]|uniref:ZAD domain-containing protein n=1 Tax=Ignelater luminosus TaxID=2038154 RepID=A0A8K0D053_IGNLU|nr:hypothetical protein ILUMI_11517 [Ignelater luminosus]
MTEVVCRTCLQVISNPLDAYSLSSKESNSDVVTLGRKLAECVPELMEISTLSLVLCWSCATAVHCAYGFRQQCLETEERIKNYILQVNSGVLTDLKQVIGSVSEVSELSSDVNIGEDVGEEFIEINDNVIYNTPAEFVQEVMNNSSLQNGSVLESFMDVENKPKLKKNGEGYSFNLTRDNRRENDTGQIRLTCKEVKSPALLKNYTRSASSPVLLKQLLQDHLYSCPVCDYKTRKNSKYQVHKRTHNSVNTKEEHHII